METMLPISSRSLQYYVIAKKWSSDLDFFRLEAGFLHRLLDRNTRNLQDREHLGQLVKTGKDLAELEQMVVDDLLAGQLTQLELMAEDIIPEDAEALAAVQVRLEQFMGALTKRFRQVKQEIYRLVLDTPLPDRLFSN